MADPQLENGYTRIANEIMDAFAKHRIPGEQRQILDVILRKTYGFNKKEDSISNSQFVELTGLKKGNVTRAIKTLIEKGVVIKSDNAVIKSDNKIIPTYRFNKNYKEWKLLSKKQVVIKKATTVIKSDNKLLSKVMDTKDNYTKDTITKERYNGNFELFWKAYPIKKAKLDAFKMWVKYNPPLDICLKAIDAQKLEKTRLKEKNEFCPEWKHPATWLNKGCWTDEVKTDVPKSTKTMTDAEIRRELDRDA